MSKTASPFYPPRARWHSPLRRIGSAVGRFLSLERLRRPGQVSLVPLLLGALVPGLAFYLAGRRFWGRFAFGGCLLLLSVFVTEMGYTLGNIAFGLAISVHATGLTLLLEPWLVAATFGRRMLWSLALLGALGWLLYMPVRSFINNNWFAPLRVNGRVFVINKAGVPGQLHRGEWLAYSLSGGDFTRAGFGMGPVLAISGDRVQFGPATYEVNGVSHPALPSMPSTGGFEVPRNHWFVWPEFDMGGHGYGGQEAVVAQAILRAAMITESQFEGKPFKRWFWHRQLPP